MNKFYFTITEGRSGSAWLARFMSENLSTKAIHEPLEIDDFGTKMPDIKIMRTFNNLGNNSIIKNFWGKKFKSIENEDIYVETNHTLSKCGLVENLSDSNLSKNTVLIILNRNIIDLCTSYMNRNDFVNITVIWQWYLHTSYKKKIINSKPFEKLGILGSALWYCYEMLARKNYYKKVFSDRVNIIEVDLDVLSSENGARNFLKKIGVNKNCIIPQKTNEYIVNNPMKIADSNKIRGRIEKYVSQLKSELDIEDIVNNLIKKNFTF